MAVYFSEGEREHLMFMRALTTNANGNEILVGLTEEESDFVVNYGRSRVSGKHNSQDDGKRYLELHDKHERQRLAILGAEIALRNENPARH